MIDRRQNCSDHTDTREIIAKQGAQLKLVGIIAAVIVVPSITALAGVLSYVLIEGHKTEIQITSTIGGISRNRADIKDAFLAIDDHEGRIRVFEHKVKP